MRALRAAWLRGGTSKGLFLRAQDLPPRAPGRDALVLAALGSPDASGLQLNGLGGGISSTSKVAILSPSSREGYDVDYLFGQVAIKERLINWEGSCGNLAAGVGLFALAEGIVQPCPAATAEAPQKMRVWQVNQGYGMVIHIPPGVSAPGILAEGGDETAMAAPLLRLAGVAGKEPPIYVELLEPHAGKPLLPTGNVVDTLELLDGSPVEATLVMAGNPTVFVSAAAAGLDGTELPEQMDYSIILPLVEHLRAQAAPLLGIALSDQPRVAFVAAPRAYESSSGEVFGADAAHLLSRISTPGRIHHAHTGTGSIALACAARVAGSTPWRCLSAGARAWLHSGAPLRIGHPGGVMEVRADVRRSDDGATWVATGAGFERTARYIMRGEVYVPMPERAP